MNLDTKCFFFAKYAFFKKMLGKKKIILSHYRLKEHYLITKRTLKLTFWLFIASIIESFITNPHS